MKAKISVQILPTLGDLFRWLKTKPQNPLFVCDNRHYFLSRSCFAIEMICDFVNRTLERSITIWVPEYFCGETLNSIRGKEGIKISFYPITDKLTPDYDECKKKLMGEKPDIFLFVHYFGNRLDVEKAREFCNLNDTVLIEDCAHVLYESEAFGKMGDFSVFSPHKCLPVVDGSVLCINKSFFQGIDVSNEMRHMVNALPRKDSRRQYVKLLLKSAIGLNARGSYTHVEHFDKPESPSPVSTISKLSMKALQAIPYNAGVDYSEIRRHNLNVLCDLLKKKGLPIRLVNQTDNDSIPYLGVFEIVDEKQTPQIINVINSLGLPMGAWTYLPYETKNLNAEVAKRFSKCCFTIPVHQNINPTTYRL